MAKPPKSQRNPNCTCRFGENPNPNPTSKERDNDASLNTTLNTTPDLSVAFLFSSLAHFVDHLVRSPPSRPRPTAASMGGGTRTTTAAVRGSALRSFFSYRVFVSAMFTLLFLATLSVLLSTSPASLQSQASESGPVRTYVSRTFLALKSDPLKTRLDLVYKQATDHVALINAYATYARKLKLENSKQLKVFEDLVQSFADLTSRAQYKQSLVDADGPVDEDVLRQFEKEAKDRIKVARQLIAETKESFDNQVKIQKLKDTIFAVNEQLAKAKKNGDVSSLISAKSIPKSLHCLAMRLVEERVIHPEKYADVGAPMAAFEDPSLYH